jgi:hypothetical protein
MTFYLQPRVQHFDLFFNQVVDPIWLATSADPAAAALRGAQQKGTRPECWRVLHRVTFVSRVLEPIKSKPGTLEHAMRSVDIDSNYELVRILDPFVRDKANDYDVFVAGVTAAIEAYLPDLRTHTADIVSFLVGYYGVTGLGGQAVAEDLSGLSVPPPAVDAGPPQAVATSGVAVLSGTVLDETAPAGSFAVLWSKLDGPGAVSFGDDDALATSAAFTLPGTYTLQLSAAGGGRATGYAVTTVVVSEPTIPKMIVSANGSDITKNAQVAPTGQPG